MGDVALASRRVGDEGDEGDEGKRSNAMPNTSLREAAPTTSLSTSAQCPI
ncbi:MAG: hypothetical protein ACYTXA_21710 [Nostoc sp.]